MLPVAALGTTVANRGWPILPSLRWRRLKPYDKLLQISEMREVHGGIFYFLQGR